MKVGVLALQGDSLAHALIVRQLGFEEIEVREPADLAASDALIIPGGESTTFRILAQANALLDPLRDRARAGMPILGTCAGLIACASTIVGGDDAILGHVDISVHRNAYGRQNESFETDLEVDEIGTVRAVFIRAPRIARVGDGVEVFAQFDGEPVAVRQGSTWLLAFHPEIAGETRIHAAWLASL